MKENEEIKKANDEYEYLTGDEEERRLAFLREKAIRDENNMLEGAREEAIQQGLEQGIQQGIQQEKIEVAKKMLEKNMTIEEIIEITGLTEEEIKS